MLPSKGDPFDALGDPHRRAIVEQLRAGDHSVQEFADRLPISRPAVSHHLRLLKEAGLVTDRAEGLRRLYRLHDEGVEAARAYLEGVWRYAAARFPDGGGEHPPAGPPVMEPLRLASSATGAAGAGCSLGTRQACTGGRQTAAELRPAGR